MQPSQIYANNNALANYGQQQAQNYTGQYGQDQGAYNQAQSNLQNYQQNMPNLGNVYNQNVGNTEQQFGFDPNSLRQAQQALATTQTTMANLPQAVQQSANGRGVTGAQEAMRLSQMGNNLNSVLAGQSNNVNALNNTYSNILNQAGAGTQFTGQSQQMQLGALQNLVGNAQAQEQQALQEVNYYEGLRAQGYQLNVSEQQAEAQAAAAYAQANAINQQTQMMAAQASLQQQELARQNQAASTQTPGGQQIYNYGNPAPNYLGAILGNIGNNISNYAGTTLNAINNLPGPRLPTAGPVVGGMPLF